MSAFPTDEMNPPKRLRTTNEESQIEVDVVGEQRSRWLCLVINY